MNSVIKLLEKEAAEKHKLLHHQEILAAKRKIPSVLLNEISEIKQAIKILKQQQVKVEKRRYSLNNV